ncbi:hypothetical protein [Ruminiclostridium cellobioparum]|uniref:Uncharacterized protein n=1 Tax=Ruminiclostridium cellobioparum subsp. termitidis CT1112 TaxID=1195236 RepID=S0FUQ3_RUMCE|nr:hypothetical protein [Ruminiclostridium cellobioparum]EMS74046.1 hypothetical protein CTER_5101 [Ruminiclostridium cellobioparum subsp. termitidis CT1112]
MSEIPSAFDFFNNINKDNDYKTFKLATVTALFTNGFPQIKFDGESTSSAKKYPILASYTPAINDRVLLAAVSSTYVILGKIKN